MEKESSDGLMSTIGSDNAENSTPSQNPFAAESDGVGSDGAQQGENSSRGAERAGSPSRDAQQTESTSRDDEQTESSSRDDEQTESASRDDEKTESASRDAQQTESSSRDDEQTESSSRGDQRTESPSRGDQRTESPPDDAQQTESTSRDAQQTESSPRDAQQTESAPRDAQQTESTSGDAQQTEGSSRDAEYAAEEERDAEHTSRASESAPGPSTATEGAQKPEESYDNAQNLDDDEFPLATSLLNGLASTLVLTEDDERSTYVNPLFADDLDLVAGVDVENVEEDRDEGDDEKKTRRRSHDAFAVSDVRIFRSGPAVCGLCPFHWSVVERTSATDDLASVDSLSGPSNIDVFRRTDVRGPSARPSDVFGGSSELWQSALFPRPGPSTEPTPGPSTEPTPGPSTEPTPGPSTEPMPSTSREATRRQQTPYKTPVVTVSPTKSTTRAKSVVEPPAEPARRPSFFRRVLKRCCCGMGMKLRCFEGNSGTNSYFLLENLGADKDASTEKQVFRFLQEELQFFDDNGSYVSVVVEKNLRAIDLTQLLAVKNRVRKDYCWSIVEHWVEIGIERVLEDHEDVLSVHRQTESGAKKYIFRRFPNKYDFFSKPEDYFPPDMIDLKTYLPGFMYPEKHPEQLERVLTTAEELPVIFSQVNLRQECNRNIWIKTFLLLKDSKILMSSKVQVVAKFLRAWRETSTGYRPLEGETSIDQDDGLEQYVAIGEGNEEELEVLADLKDYEVYTSLNAKNQLKGPTEFGVVLRKTNEEDFADPVVLSFDKGKDRVCWVTAMRLAKYGKQLRENYKAFKNKQETISSNGSSANITESVRSRVAMDFTGKVGRIVDDPMEAKAIAVSEGNAWKKRLRAKAESSRCGGLTLEAGEEEKSHHGQPWYHRNMSREHATALISAHAKHDGVFVVRGSRSQPGGNVLSFKSQEKVLHFPIMMVEDPVEKIMCYTIDGGTTKFFDICQLVEFYRLNAGPLPTRLSNHLEKLPQPKTPGASTKTDAQ